MKIAFVGQPTSPLSLPYDGYDSIGIVTYHLARMLARRAEVTVYAPARDSEPNDEQAYEGFAVKRFRFQHKWWGLIGAAAVAANIPTATNAFALYGYRFATGVARGVARRGSDIVHIMSLPILPPLSAGGTQAPRLSSTFMPTCLTDFRIDGLSPAFGLPIT